MEDRNFWNPRQFLSQGPHTDFLGLTPSEPQHGASRLKCIKGIKGETEVSGIRVRAGGQLLPDRSAGRDILWRWWRSEWKSH